MMKKATCVLSILLFLMMLSNIPAGAVHAATATCPDCKGTGAVKCADCNGTGEGGICTTCNGMGIDEWSDDSCPDCGGLGLFMCGTCDGRGDFVCKTCNGTGVITVADTKNVSKKTNPITIKTSAKTVKASKLKSAKRTVKPLNIKNAKGAVTVKKVKSGTTAAINKKVTVASKTGAITLAKGKYKKGKYKVKLKITAAGDKTYKEFSKTVTVKVTIK